jgi:DNA-directed RNA polymerase specialized sigma24 family protein
VTTTLTRPIQRSQGSQMDDLQLQQLVRAIQASPDRQDRDVRKQMNLLLTEVSSRLQPAKGYWIKQYSSVFDIESIVGGAVTDTLLAVTKNIGRYEPDKAQLMTWINRILRNKVFDAVARSKSYQDRYDPISIDEPISEDNPNSIAEAKLQDKIEEEESAKAEDLESTDLRARLRQFIETDPEGCLAKKHIREKPEATFQKILLMRLVPMTWHAIADSFDISSHGTIIVVPNKNETLSNTIISNNLVYGSTWFCVHPCSFYCTKVMLDII